MLLLGITITFSVIILTFSVIFVTFNVIIAGFFVYFDSMSLNEDKDGDCEEDYVQFGRDILFITSHRSNKYCGVIEGSLVPAPPSSGTVLTCLVSIAPEKNEFFIATHISCNMMRIGHGQSFGVIGPFFHLAPLIFLINFFTFLVKFGRILDRNTYIM